MSCSILQPAFSPSDKNPYANSFLLLMKVYLNLSHHDQPESEVTAEQRAGVKQTVYGILYGMSPKSLAKSLSVSDVAAVDLISTFMNRFNVRS